VFNGDRMTIRTVHQVISKKGIVVGEYMDHKLAKEMDNRTDVLYYIADMIEEQGVKEDVAEQIAEVFLDDNNRQALMAKLKSVKNLPVDSAEEIVE
tara:strand:+ start:6185 stop:6472 length:288 start_codon:yes stop_codon:yes gene_type:complete